MAEADPSTGSSLLDEISEVIGREATLKFSLRFGGLGVYVLRRHSDDHPLVQAIGRAAADELEKHYAGTTLTVAKIPGQRAEVLRLADHSTLTRREIAEQVNVPERTVFRWLAERDEARNNSRQGELFSARFS